MDENTYSDVSNVITKLLTLHYSRLIKETGMDSVRGVLTETRYGKIVLVSFVFSKPFSGKMADYIYYNIKKRDINMLLDNVLSLSDIIEVSINTCTIDMWEKKHKPRMGRD